jgi:hypothetical protein
MSKLQNSRGKELFINLHYSKNSVILRINLKVASVLEVDENSKVRRQEDFWKFWIFRKCHQMFSNVQIFFPVRLRWFEMSQWSEN